MWRSGSLMPNFLEDDIEDSKDLSKIYEKTHSIEETLIEYVEDELLDPEKPNLDQFETAVESIKKFALGCFDNHPKCKRSKNDIEMAVIIWISEEKEKNITKNDLVKRLDILGNFVIDEAKKRLIQ